MTSVSPHTIPWPLVWVLQGDYFHIHFSEAPDNTCLRVSLSSAVRKWKIASIPTITTTGTYWRTTIKKRPLLRGRSLCKTAIPSSEQIYAIEAGSLWDQMSINQPSLLTIWDTACIIAGIRGFTNFLVTLADSSMLLQVFPSLPVPYKPKGSC